MSDDRPNAGPSGHAPTAGSETERVCRRVLDALPAMVGYWDRDLRNVVANRAYVSFFGKTPDQMRGRHIRDLLGPELYEMNRPYMERALAGEEQLFDRAIPTPSGELRYTQASYIPDVVDGEVRGFFVLVTDITDRRRIEEEVARSRAQLAAAEHIARLGSWEWDIVGDRVEWSDGLYELYGIGPEEFDERYRMGGERWVHPDDRERVESAVRRALETCGRVDVEYRIIRPNGRVRHLHGRAEVIADDEGRPARMTGTALDVTELRAAEEALSRTAAELGGHAARLQAAMGSGPLGGRNPVEGLAGRQLEILALVAEGLSNAEISDRLYLSESTVKWHMRKILRTLGVSNRAQAVGQYLAARPPTPDGNAR